MKKIFEWIGGFALIAFSFYFTDQVSLLVANKSSLMEEIKMVNAEYRMDAIDAVINPEDNTIIPGKYGREVNNNESYLSMHEFGVFNENYLVFSYIKPRTSLEDNKDKYIIEGNSANRQISLIVDDNKAIANYLDDKKIIYNVIAKSEEDLKSKTIEYINGASTKEDFKSLNSKISNNKKICIKDYSELNSCVKYNYYIIQPALVLQLSNIVDLKNRISSGTIILISTNAKLEHLKIILNEINYKDLEIVSISSLIDEKKAK